MPLANGQITDYLLKTFLQRPRGREIRMDRCNFIILGSNLEKGFPHKARLNRMNHLNRMSHLNRMNSRLG